MSTYPGTYMRVNDRNSISTIRRAAAGPCPIFILGILLSLALPVRSQETPPDSGFRVIDYVDLPGAWSGEDEGEWYLWFRERWSIDPRRPAVTKTVDEYRPFNDAIQDASPDSLQQRFALLVGKQPVTDGKVVLKGITYEFVLLDPHLESSGNIAYPSADSMDAGTRTLQQALISLVRRRSYMASMFDLEDQLLSVHFHEDWYMDPVSLAITREVRALTPVIWQRRRTIQGDPVNDAETGYPVYYKNLLQRIELRNP